MDWYRSGASQTRCIWHASRLAGGPYNAAGGATLRSHPREDLLEPSRTVLSHSSYSNSELIRRLLALCWIYRRHCLEILLYQIVLLLLVIAGMGVIGLGFDIVRHQLQPTSPLPHWPLGFVPPPTWSPLARIGVISGVLGAMALVRLALNHLYTNSVTRLVQLEIVVELRSKVYDKLQRLSFRFFDANASGSIINRVTGDVQNVRAFVDGVMIQGVIILISLTLYLAYMLAINPQLTLVSLAIVPLLGIMTFAFSHWVRPEYARNRDLVDDMILSYTQTIQGMQVIKGFAHESARRSVFAEANAAVRDQQGRIFWRISLFTPVIELLSQCSLFVLLLYGGHLVLQGQLPLGTGLVVFIGLLSQFSAQVSAIANITNTAQQSLVSARRVFEVLDAPVEIQSPKVPESASAGQGSRLRGAITFQGVGFHYKVDEPLLMDLDFHAAAGQCVAIIGATGSGKSSLMGLIPRFYDPTKGRVLIDGMDVRRMDLERLRRSIGLVFQESFLFSNTIAANIAFGDPHATQERIEKAARLALAHDFIVALPQGYKTILGESGYSLSGGQRQRLAIARAVLLEPPILLLDDPTAAIDAETEHEILQALDTAISGRTTIIVAHRLSTLRRADFILVLDRGRIVERGTHRELMESGGHYFNAAKLQLLDDDSQRLLGGRRL
jgi:ATP-binding cassette subfamily B protein